jgi:hypothetical protein
VPKDINFITTHSQTKLAVDLTSSAEKEHSSTLILRLVIPVTLDVMDTVLELLTIVSLLIQDVRLLTKFNLPMDLVFVEKDSIFQENLVYHVKKIVDNVHSLEEIVNFA